MSKRIHRLALPLLGAALLLGASTFGAAADTLEKIKQRGTIIVGVKADFKPWGFLDSSGKPVGMEIDLAEDVAKRLGVKLETVVVQTSNRVQFLDQGKIDIMIATLGDLPARRKSVGMVTPHYNMSGTNVLAPKKHGFKQWSELKGKTVCGTQGSYYNKMQSEAHGLNVVAFKTVEEALAALRAGNCVGFLQNDALISIILTDQANWKDYETPLLSEDNVPHSIGVLVGEANAPIAKTLSKIAEDWHRTGKLLEVQKKWGIPHTKFHREMHEKYKGTPAT